VVTDANNDSLGLAFEDIGVSPEEGVFVLRLPYNCLGDAIFFSRIVSGFGVFLVVSLWLADFEVS
jgi:hypothetical protein